jgi:hypothetical protein
MVSVVQELNYNVYDEFADIVCEPVWFVDNIRDIPSFQRVEIGC